MRYRASMIAATVLFLTACGGPSHKSRVLDDGGTGMNNGPNDNLMYPDLVCVSDGDKHNRHYQIKIDRWSGSLVSVLITLAQADENSGEQVSEMMFRQIASDGIIIKGHLASLRLRYSSGRDYEYQGDLKVVNHFSQNQPVAIRCRAIQ